MSLARNVSDMKRDAAFAVGVARRRPFNVLVQVTNRCNMRCSFCDFWPHPAPPRDELTVDDYRRLADDLAALGTFLVSIEGGEPLARADLVDVVAAFGRRHLPVLYTNGWFVGDDVARRLWDAGLVHASVSIDYAAPARHDGKRGLDGAWAQAWRAVDSFRRWAPRGGKQAHVMTVVMADNVDELEPLLAMSSARGVGHQMTLLATEGFRRGGGAVDRLPPVGTGARLEALWRRHPHLGFFRDYFARMDDFLGGGAMPTCRAGVQSFNVDHVGDVAPCIEKIERRFGNVKRESIVAIHARMAAAVDEVARCQDCWTACRGIATALCDGGSPGAWLDLARRMKSS